MNVRWKRFAGVAGIEITLPTQGLSSQATGE